MEGVGGKSLSLMLSRGSVLGELLGVDVLIGNKTRELQLVLHYQAATATDTRHTLSFVNQPDDMTMKMPVHRG